MTQPSRRASVLIPLLGLIAAAAGAGCGPAGEPGDWADEPGPPWATGCPDGKCDGLEGVTLAVCGPREAALGQYGCTQASAADIGIDPTIPEKPVSLQVALAGLDQPGVAVAVEVADDAGEIVRTVPLDDVRDGVHVLRWDGHDERGGDADAPWHAARLRASYGAESITSDDHVIATLVNLPDEGEGYTHPLGTDARNSDDWGRPHVVAALTAVAEAWTGEPRLAYLDLSLHNGGQFKPHWTHRHGECVDIRYVRNDGEGALDLRWGQDEYDAEATQSLVDGLVAAGAIEIFCDPRSKLAGDFIVHVEGHTNHLHAVFGLTPDDTGAERPINVGRAGGPCRDDSDCNLRDGWCELADGEALGMCTAPCESSCSDYVGGIYTLSECVDSDAGRLCVPARDRDRYPDSDGCREGLSPSRAPSHDQGGALTDVCLPP